MGLGKMALGKAKARVPRVPSRVRAGDVIKFVLFFGAAGTVSKIGLSLLKPKPQKQEVKLVEIRETLATNNWFLFTGVNFINILLEAFTGADPKSVKRY